MAMTTAIPILTTTLTIITIITPTTMITGIPMIMGLDTGTAIPRERPKLRLPRPA